MQPSTEWHLVNWIDHVVTEYHRPLAGEIARLEHLAARIEPGPLDAALAVASELYRELLLHVRKEENVLFPWMRAGRGATAGGPVQVMTLEHQETREVMAQVRAAAEKATSPAGRAWAEAYLVFDDRLREHMRIEEKELFPRALAGH
jgi:regulator of cell morphogenesis and NO signaling